MTSAQPIDPSAAVTGMLATASPDLLRSMLSTFIQALMGADADAVCGAGYGERSPERVNSRNGYRHRDFDTRAGTIDVAIPKLRSGTYFPDWLLERRTRAERALVSVVATSYLLGVSTRRVEKLVQALGVTSLSKSQVSIMARELDEQVEAFRTRPLDQGPYTFVAADALALKVREGGRVVQVHALLATGVNADGHREILGLDVTTGEDGAGWLAFFRGLVARGLAGVKLVTSDAHNGLVAAIGATLPGASWQRCRTHYAVNLMSVTPKAQLAVGAHHAALDLRPGRRESRCRPVRPGHRHTGREAPRGRRAPRPGPRRRARVHRIPEGDLAPDLVQQPGAPRGAVCPWGGGSPSSSGCRSGLMELGAAGPGGAGSGGSSPDNDGTGRHRQTARVRQARRRGVRMQEPVVEPPEVERRLEPDGSGPVSGARGGQVGLAVCRDFGQVQDWPGRRPR